PDCVDGAEDLSSAHPLLIGFQHRGLPRERDPEIRPLRPGRILAAPGIEHVLAGISRTTVPGCSAINIDPGGVAALVGIQDRAVPGPCPRGRTAGGDLVPAPGSVV